MALFGFSSGQGGFVNLQPVAATAPVFGPGNVATGQTVAQVTSGGSQLLGQYLNQPVGQVNTFPVQVNQPPGGFQGPGGTGLPFFGQGPPGFNFSGFGIAPGYTPSVSPPIGGASASNITLGAALAILASLI